jgi:hypothetical protein
MKVGQVRRRRTVHDHAVNQNFLNVRGPKDSASISSVRRIALRIPLKLQLETSGLAMSPRFLGKICERFRARCSYPLPQETEPDEHASEQCSFMS